MSKDEKGLDGSPPTYEFNKPSDTLDYIDLFNEVLKLKTAHVEELNPSQSLKFYEQFIRLPIKAIKEINFINFLNLCERYLGEKKVDLILHIIKKLKLQLSYPDVMRIAQIVNTRYVYSDGSIKKTYSEEELVKIYNILLASYFTRDLRGENKEGKDQPKSDQELEMEKWKRFINLTPNKEELSLMLRDALGILEKKEG